jgi:hypothetical protein
MFIAFLRNTLFFKKDKQLNFYFFYFLGFKIHSAIHTSKRGQENGDILWTMHTHTNETVAVSNYKDGLLPGLSQFASKF